MSQQSIAPGLLLAMPQMTDPNFYRTVVLMIEHTERGSVGVIVNRPTTTTIAEVMRQVEIGWNGDPEALVFFGGPVEPRSGWLLHDPAGPSESEETIQLAPGLAVSTSPDLLSQLAEHPRERMRLLLGYSGWSEGQLERELAGGAWVLAEASAELVFATPHEEMWEAALHQLHIDPTSLFPASGIH